MLGGGLCCDFDTPEPSGSLLFANTFQSTPPHRMTCWRTTALEAQLHLLRHADNTGRLCFVSLTKILFSIFPFLGFRGGLYLDATELEDENVPNPIGCRLRHQPPAEWQCRRNLYVCPFFFVLACIFCIIAGAMAGTLLCAFFGVAQAKTEQCAANVCIDLLL